MKWNDFLNPRSMLTPGIAGSVVMVIANTLWIEFMLPQKWTALALSFLLIIPILIKFSANIVENVIYFTFNGLIVFALAVNTNFAGRTLQNIAQEDKSPLVAQLSTALKASHTSTIPVTGNEVQLASNDDSKTSTNATSVRRENNKEQPDEQDKDKKAKKKKLTDPKNREFFGEWF
jgi:hypothetical protein